MKIGFVVPRYGAEVIGGAEGAARMLAERLVDSFGWTVEALTSCAQSAMTWENVYEPGEEKLNGVTIRRFEATSERSEHYHGMSARLFADPARCSMADAQRWVEMQGPACPELIDAIVDSDADLLVYYPYLFYPTIRGIPLSRSRAVLHPAAHDEPALRLPVFDEVFRGARGIAYHTYAERRLVHKLFPVASTPSIVLGLGIEHTPGQARPADDLLGLGDRPYLVCLGRVEDGKGSNALVRSFIAYKRRRPGPLALVFVGPINDRQPVHPDIVLTGPVDEAAKWGILEGAMALVSPSAMESFSLVVMEAWKARIPIVVNGLCDVTREHCERSGGGLWFDSYPEFEVVIDRLVADPTLRKRLGEAGARYVEQNFSWPGLLERYRSFLERLA